MVTFGYKKCRMDMEIDMSLLRKFRGDRYRQNFQKRWPFDDLYSIRYEQHFRIFDKKVRFFGNFWIQKVPNGYGNCDRHVAGILG